MELSSSLLATLKHVSNDDSLSLDDFEHLIKTVFDTFLINTKLGKLDPKFETKNLGIL